MKDFDQWMTEYQSSWRKAHVVSQELGQQNGKRRPWIMPRRLWEDGL